jgi:transposase-like protein
MLLKQTTVRNVSRALREINAFETEGDFKPQARQALKQLLEKRLEEEMAEYLGVARYEHAAERHDYRNGHYVRHLLTEMGDLQLIVPRSRKGKFPSKLMGRYARRCRSVDQVLLACFCLGLSTRKAASVLAPMLGKFRPQPFRASHGIWIPIRLYLTMSWPISIGICSLTGWY